MRIARWWTPTKVGKYWHLGPFTTITVQTRHRARQHRPKQSLPAVTATYAELCRMRDQQTLGQ